MAFQCSTDAVKQRLSTLRIGGERRSIAIDPPFEVLAPGEQTLPFIFASPHSGRVYPKGFLQATRLDGTAIRRSEDSFVDEIFGAAPSFGAPLLKAHFPRAFVDPNREAYELDQTMFDTPLPQYVNTRSPRVLAGLGTIARVVRDGAEIYRTKLSFQEALSRIDAYYKPYHSTLRGLLETTQKKFNYAVLIDCHSMPSVGGPLDQDIGAARPDIVLGDRYGTSCARRLTDTIERALSMQGFAVVRNNPYAGGYTTESDHQRWEAQRERRIAQFQTRKTVALRHHRPHAGSCILRQSGLPELRRCPVADKRLPEPECVSCHRPLLRSCLAIVLGQR